MPDIGVITFLHNDNYGSTLQAWSLQRALTGLGFSVEHLDYRPDTREKVRNMVLSGNSPGLLLDSLRRRRVRAAERGAAEKAEAFRRFQREELRLRGPLKSQAALRQAAGEERLLLCGSDQVWSPEWLNPAYFLNFARPGQKKIAYACSLGVSTLPGGRKRRLMSRLMEGFQAISVREEEGARILRTIAPAVKVSVMPDPVFLTPRDEWLRLARQPEQAGGLVCYLMGEREDAWQRAAGLSRELGKDITVIPVGALSYAQPWNQAAGLDPRDWLGLLGGAEHICTDSFHGAAFALLLGIPVTILRRYREDQPNSKNSRIDQLLRWVGREGAETVWPCGEVDARVAEARQRGLTWLKEAIQAAAQPGPAAEAR